VETQVGILENLGQKCPFGLFRVEDVGNEQVKVDWNIK
jgi:hypothetical protein